MVEVGVGEEGLDGCGRADAQILCSRGPDAASETLVFALV